jgi:hypothetical protein
MNIYVKSLKRDAKTGLVTSILWAAIKNTASTKGEQFLPEKSIADVTFVPYKDIDEQTAKQWLLDSFGADGLLNIESYLNGVIADQANVIAGVPWQANTDSGDATATPTRKTHF